MSFVGITTEHDMENTEKESGKVQVSMRLDASLVSIVSELAESDHRSLTNMVEVLLRTSPQIAQILEASETAAVTA